MRSISTPGIGSGSSWRIAAVALPAHAQRVLRVEPSGRARRRGQLLDRHLQRGRHLVEHGERRVAGARLEVAPGRPRQPREPRHLLLREPARLAQLAHVLAEPGRRASRPRQDDSRLPMHWQCVLVYWRGGRSCIVEETPCSSRDGAALVTGASRGLGAALAAELARRGARVVLVARGEAALEAVAAADPRGGRRGARARRRRGRQGGRPPARRRGRGARGADRPAGPERQHARAACRCASCSTPSARTSRACWRSTCSGRSG